jgi:hypothetical protein
MNQLLNIELWCAANVLRSAAGCCFRLTRTELHLHLWQQTLVCRPTSAKSANSGCEALAGQVKAAPMPMEQKSYSTRRRSSWAVRIGMVYHLWQRMGVTVICSSWFIAPQLVDIVLCILGPSDLEAGRVPEVSWMFWICPRNGACPMFGPSKANK